VLLGQNALQASALVVDREFLHEEMAGQGGEDGAQVN